MSATEFVLRHPAMLALGWALVHFLWQGTLVGIVAAMLLRAARSASASTRYAIATIAMAAMFVVAVGTWGYLAGRQAVIAPPPTSQASYDDVVVPGAGTARDVVAVRSSAPRAPTRPVATVQLARVPLALSVFLFVYAVGVLVLSLRLAGGWYFARRLTRRLVKPAAADLVTLADRVADRLAMRRVIRLLESSLVSAPAVVGWFAPVVLLPAAALAGLSAAQIEALIAHELAHVKRHDYLVNLLQSAVATLLFYHPAVWWVSRQVRIEREHCCDDVAVALCGDRIVYASALAELETMRTPALALAATDGPLVSRVRRILSAPSEPRATAPGWMGALLVVLMVAALVPVVRSVATADAQQAKTKPATPASPAKPAPAATPAKPAEAVVIHANDVLRVNVAGDAAMSRDYIVQADGVVVLPLLRPMKVAGLTTDRVEAAIASALAPAPLDSATTAIDLRYLDAEVQKAEVAYTNTNARRAVAKDAMDRLSAYRVDNSKTDIEKSGVLNEPELRGDSEVLAIREALRALRSQLSQLAQMGAGADNPNVARGNGQVADNLAQLRTVVTSALATARVHLDLAEVNAAAAKAELDAHETTLADFRRAGGSAKPKVTVTIVKPAPTPVKTPETQAAVTAEQFHSQTPAKSVTVAGEVNKPGVVEYADGMTVEQAINAAGGFTEDALITDRFPVTRLRPTDHRYIQLRITLSTTLQAGDLVRVPKVKTALAESRKSEEEPRHERD